MRRKADLYGDYQALARGFDRVFDDFRCIWSREFAIRGVHRISESVHGDGVTDPSHGTNFRRFGMVGMSRAMIGRGPAPDEHQHRQEGDGG
jgi:hypothetical protein